MMKSALITGITGQDGHHLTSFLRNKDYKVFGMVNGQRTHSADNFLRLFPDVTLLQGDLADFSSILNVINVSAPDEVYNLGGISHVGMSFQQPEITSNITGLGALRVLEAIRKSGGSSKFYQASSSEMFGKVTQIPQTEITTFYPRSPYGVAKVFAHYMTINYRESYGMKSCSGILFNHEGEHRGYEFVTRKITANVAKIKLGKIEKFSLGNLAPRRDWGYAGDYVEAMWLMMQQEIMDDYVISTGVTHTVREFLECALRAAELPEEIERFVELDSSQIRPAEVDILQGDSTKAKSKLGWEPRTSFEKLVEIMVENDLKIESSK